jgi:hypothetical protein
MDEFVLASDLAAELGVTVGELADAAASMGSPARNNFWFLGGETRIPLDLAQKLRNHFARQKA